MEEEKKEKEDIKSEESVKEEIKELPKEENVESASVGKKILKVIKMFFLIITSPIWFPWKVLFVRKEERKFKNVDSKTRMLRIVRGFITKPLKFGVYLFIILLEVVLIYKARFSVVTYSFTKSSVREYYLNNESVEEESIVVNRDNISKAFEYVDEWNLGEKNKMYVIMDSDASKLFFKYASPQMITYIFDRFNNEEEFRNNIRSIVGNINSLISRGYREIADMPGFEEVTSYLSPIVDVTSIAMDYTVILDVIGRVGKYAEEHYEISTDNSTFDSRVIDVMYEAIVNFNNGMSIIEVAELVNSEYND